MGIDWEGILGAEGEDLADAWEDHVERSNGNNEFNHYYEKFHYKKNWCYNADEEERYRREYKYLSYDPEQEEDLCNYFVDIFYQQDFNSNPGISENIKEINNIKILIDNINKILPEKSEATSDFDEYFPYFYQYNDLRDELLSKVNNCGSLEEKIMEIDKFMKKMEEERYKSYVEIMEEIQKLEEGDDCYYDWTTLTIIEEIAGSEFFISRISLSEHLSEILEYSNKSEEETIGYLMEWVKNDIFPNLFSSEYLNFLENYYGYHNYKNPHNFGLPSKFKIDSYNSTDKKLILSDILIKLESNKSPINNLVIDKALLYNSIQGDTEKIREEVSEKYLECVTKLMNSLQYYQNSTAVHDIEFRLGEVYSWIYQKLDEVKEYTDFIIFESLLEDIFSVFKRYTVENTSTTPTQSESDFDFLVDSYEDDFLAGVVNPFMDLEKSKEKITKKETDKNTKDSTAFNDGDDFLADVVNPFRD